MHDPQNAEPGTSIFLRFSDPQHLYTAFTDGAIDHSQFFCTEVQDDVLTG